VLFSLAVVAVKKELKGVCRLNILCIENPEGYQHIAVVGIMSQSCNTETYC
jgi:hypothetical protein